MGVLNICYLNHYMERLYSVGLHIIDMRVDGNALCDTQPEEQIDGRAHLPFEQLYSFAKEARNSYEGCISKLPGVYTFVLNWVALSKSDLYKYDYCSRRLTLDLHYSRYLQRCD